MLAAWKNRMGGVSVRLALALTNASALDHLPLETLISSFKISALVISPILFEGTM